jgi:transposase
MISVEDREKIRWAYFIEQKSVRQIARELHVARKTIRKAIASAEADVYTLQAPRLAPLLGPYKGRIDELLAENEQLPPKQRYTGHLICKELAKIGYQGSEPTVRRYIAQRRREKRRPKVYIPLEFDPATDAQADWGEAVVEIAGERITVQIFHMRLCYSRKLFMMAFPTQNQEAFFEGHVRAFHYFGGVPHRITYDNLKAAVQRLLAGHSRQEQVAFIALRSHYLFESYFCTRGQGRAEGRRGARCRLWSAQLPGTHPASGLLCRAECLAADALPRE